MKKQAIAFISLNGEVVPAGRLIIEETSQRSRSLFSYGRRYLERKDAISLDPVSLPLRHEEFETEESFTIFNGIRDAAPDAWGRRLIDLHMLRHHGRPALEQDYLMISQSGCRAGALQFGKTPDSPSQILDYNIPAVDTHLGDLEYLMGLADHVSSGGRIPPGLEPYLGASTDMGGARPKATVTIDGFPWLAKFSMPEDRIDMPAAEAGCLDLCEMAGIPACERRIETIAGRRVLLVKRFDREILEAGLSRIPMISSLTMTGAHEMDRGMSGYADIFDSLRRHGRVQGAGEQIFRRMVMNVLCGNIDDHYRNHAFLSKEGSWELAPVYDVTPTLQASPTKHLFFHLGKAGSGREATLEAAISGAESLGIRKEDAYAMAQDMCRMVRANWHSVMASRGASEIDIGMMRNSFSQSENPSFLSEDNEIDDFEI